MGDVMKNKVVYVYENHAGGDNFISDTEYTDKELYCEECRDSDRLLYKGTYDEILTLLKKDIKKAQRIYKKATTDNERFDAEFELDRAVSNYQYINNLLNQYFWDREEEEC